MCRHMLAANNIVLPVKTSKDKGTCKNLASYFESSEVISWNLYQFGTGGQIFIYSKKDAEVVNKKIPKLEIIEGKQYPYFYSTLGKLEYYLEYFNTHPL